MTEYYKPSCKFCKNKSCRHYPKPPSHPCIPGKDGETPYIGENGNWWIGDVDTGVPAKGEKGDKGDPGESKLIPWANASANGTQTILSNSPVVFVNETISNISFDGTSLFTIQEPGIYSLQCTLNILTTSSNSTGVYVEVNGNIVSASAISGTPVNSVAGQIVLVYANVFQTGDKIQIINSSSNTVNIINAPNLPNSAGHICIYKISDSPTP